MKGRGGNDVQHKNWKGLQLGQFGMPVLVDH